MGRMREELRKQCDALFSAHETNMKNFDGEAKKIQTERKAINDRIHSEKLIRQRTLEKEKQDERDSLERFKNEIGANEVRGVSHNAGRFRKLHDSAAPRTRRRTTRTRRTTSKRRRVPKL